MGDEATLGANLQHWRSAVPDCRITVLSPDPPYTEKMHGCRSEPAPRVVFFKANEDRHYGQSTFLFKLRYFLLAPLSLLNARLMAAGLPVCGLTASQGALLDQVRTSDLLFFSGGGYLTGLTLSRLWDSMLLIRLANLLGVPVFFVGADGRRFQGPAQQEIGGLGSAKGGPDIPERRGILGA